MHEVCPDDRVACDSMRAVVQRVSQASVTSDGQVAGAIDEPGLLVLVGVTHDDTPGKAAKLAAKLWGLRILDGEKSCSDVGAPLLVISQFTLYADLAKGRRPSWSAAAPGPVAEPIVATVVQSLRDLGARVQTGVFGAHMMVALVNDGPVTIILDLLRPGGARLSQPGQRALRAGSQRHRIRGPERALAERLRLRPAVMQYRAARGVRHGDVHAAVAGSPVSVAGQRPPSAQAAEGDDDQRAYDGEDPLLPRRQPPRLRVGLGVHG
jgi:D-tyrosyl-tRNA(Tyr) deacylase